jgi:hypothetical protein
MRSQRVIFPTLSLGRKLGAVTAPRMAPREPPLKLAREALILVKRGAASGIEPRTHPLRESLPVLTLALTRNELTVGSWRNSMGLFGGVTAAR